MLTAYENNLEEHFLIDLHEFLVPLIDIRSLLAGVGIVIIGRRRITLVVDTPLDNLVENGLVDLVYPNQLVQE